MNYEEARQVDPNSDRPDAGKWRWTTANRRTGTYPTGGCSEWEACPYCQAGMEWDDVSQNHQKCRNCDGQGALKKADPCPGHHTPEEAAEHNRQYRISKARFRTLNNPDALYRCQIKDCKTYTDGVMEIEGDGYFVEIVCPEHQTPETIRELIPASTWSAHS